MQRLSFSLFFITAILAFSSCTKKEVPDSPGDDDGGTTPGVSVTVTAIAGKLGDKGNAEDGNGSDARFWNPTKMVYDSRDNRLYVADGTVIRSIDAQNNVETYMPLGVISRWAEILDMDVAPGAGGSLYIVTAENDLLKIEPDGASVKKTVLIDRIYGGNETGALNSADELDGTHGLAGGKNGDLFIFNSFWNTMRRVTVTSWSPVAGTVAPFAGKPTATRSGDAWTYADGQGEAATFAGTVGDIASDANGNIYVADYWNDELRMVTPGGRVSSFLKYKNGLGVDVDGPVGRAQANRITNVASTPDGSQVFFGTFGDPAWHGTPALRVVQNQ